MRPETRQRLMNHFREDVERLGMLLGEDVVARWYTETPIAVPAEVPSDG
jgi:hypothetical protein